MKSEIQWLMAEMKKLGHQDRLPSAPFLVFHAQQIDFISPFVPNKLNCFSEKISGCLHFFMITFDFLSIFFLSGKNKPLKAWDESLKA